MAQIESHYQWCYDRGLEDGGAFYEAFRQWPTNTSTDLLLGEAGKRQELIVKGALPAHIDKAYAAWVLGYLADRSEMHDP